MIDTDRMTNGKQVADELRRGKNSGIPWMVILDGDGEEQINSFGPKGNVGCPADPHEIDHFLAMIDKTRQHMSATDRGILERELRAYGASLKARPNKIAGYADFSRGVKDVKAGQFDAAMKTLGKALDAGFPPQKLLVDRALRPLREDPDQRLKLFELFERHVEADQVQIVDPLEPGRRIRLEGRVVDMKTGAPVPGAVLKLFHTDAGGEYRPGMDAGGGAGNPRLWGFVRADPDGRFTVDTIMPERYANSSVPRHVHYHAWAKGGYPKVESECFFDEDPLLDAKTRQSAPARGFPIVKLKLGADLRLVGEFTVRLTKGQLIR